jgi:hypothetical protein
MVFGLDSQVLNLLLGASITIGSTLGAWAILHWNQRRVSRDRTRRAIIHEIDYITTSVGQLIDLESGKVSDGEIDHVIITLSPDVIEEDFQQIKQLTSPEVESIYEFYELSRVLKRKLDSGNDNKEKTKQVATEIIQKGKEVDESIKRSRLSLFTEWYKQRDRELRNK